MSLTNELRDPQSPIRAYLDGISPSLARSRGNSPAARAMAERLHLGAVASSLQIAPAAAGVDTARSGTAFDIRSRIALVGYDVHRSASALGITRLRTLADQIDNGQHRAAILTEAFQIAESDRGISSPGSRKGQARARHRGCVVRGLLQATKPAND